MKRSLSIEKLLHWAYREELAKQDFLGAETQFWSSMAELGTKVSSSGNGLQAYAAIIGNGVHPDALAVHREVMALDRSDDGTHGAMQPDWHDPAALLSDMPEAVRALAAEAVKGYRVQIGMLVIRCARNATMPDWRAEPPVERVVRSPRTGQPAWFIRERVPVFSAGVKVGEEIAERDGFDRTQRRPKPAAYRKTFYDPDPGTIVDLRADYACWHAALEALTESLGQGLQEHCVLPPRAAALPWEPSGEGSQQRESRTLPVLRRCAA